jgi:hypothetical protein
MQEPPSILTDIGNHARTVFGRLAAVAGILVVLGVAIGLRTGMTGAVRTETLRALDAEDMGRILTKVS